MSDYISREAVIESLQDWKDHCMTDAEEWHIRQVIGDVKSLPVADVVEVHAVINRMNEERKRAKGNWNTDPYWLGWVDAMSRAQRIVDGTIDDEPMYAPSTGEKKEDNQG